MDDNLENLDLWSGDIPDDAIFYMVVAGADYKVTAEQILSAVRPVIEYLELRLFIKGNGNIATALESGDYVQGLWDSTTYAGLALYNGGDVANRSNYTLITSNEF